MAQQLQTEVKKATKATKTAAPKAQQQKTAPKAQQQKTAPKAQQQKTAPGITLAQINVMGDRYASFLITGIMYHTRQGRLAANAEGWKPTTDGQKWFSAGGRHANPEDVSRMRAALMSGKPFIAHNGQESKMEKAPKGAKFAYMLAESSLVAGRVDSQAQFACMML